MCDAKKSARENDKAPADANDAAAANADAKNDSVAADADPNNAADTNAKNDAAAEADVTCAKGQGGIRGEL